MDFSEMPEGEELYWLMSSRDYSLFAGRKRLLLAEPKRKHGISLTGYSFRAMTAIGLELWPLIKSHRRGKK